MAKQDHYDLMDMKHKPKRYGGEAEDKPVTKIEAMVSRLPEHSGDGYSYGGGCVVTIDGVSLVIGEGATAWRLAKEIARRWNVMEQPDDKD